MKISSHGNDEGTAIFPRVPEPRLVVSLSTMDTVAAAYEAIVEFRAQLEVTFGRHAGRKPLVKRRESMTIGLDGLYVFLKRIGLEHLAGEYDELRSALRDANIGVAHPLFEPATPVGKRRSLHRDPSQIWRARANLALAIEAKHALLEMDRTKEPEATTLSIAAADILQRDNFVLARQIAARTSRGRLARGDVSKASEKKSLVKMALGWKKNLSSRASNPEAAELYEVTHALIERSISESDKDMLHLIETRCLKAAQTDGALNAHLEAP